MSFSSAKRFFGRAIESIGGKVGERGPADEEKFNLYMGLRRLADALEDLEHKLK